MATKKKAAAKKPAAKKPAAKKPAAKKAVKKVKDSVEKSTLGDISALSDLKNKMEGK